MAPSPSRTFLSVAAIYLSRRVTSELDYSSGDEKESQNAMEATPPSLLVALLVPPRCDRIGLSQELQPTTRLVI